MRHNHSWQHKSTPKRMMGIKVAPYGVCLLLLLGVNDLLDKELPLLWLLSVNTQFIPDKQDTRKSDCWALPIHGIITFKNFLLLQIFYEIFYACSQNGCRNIAEKNWATAQAASCLCHLLHIFRSCLVCVYCSFSGLWRGWRQDRAYQIEDLGSLGKKSNCCNLCNLPITIDLDI